MSRLVESDRDLSRAHFGRDGVVRDERGRPIPDTTDDSVVIWILDCCVVLGLLALALVLGLIIGGCK